MTQVRGRSQSRADGAEPGRTSFQAACPPCTPTLGLGEWGGVGTRQFLQKRGWRGPAEIRRPR